MSERKYLKLTSLIVWTDNPRHGINTGEDEFTEIEVINILIDVVGIEKMYNLIEDIYHNEGLLGNVNPVVVPNDNQKFDVYDGNRRITALKVINEPNLIENDDLRKKVLSLTQNKSISFVDEVFVYITDKEEELMTMDKTHSGELDGVGMISWEPYQRDISLHRRGKSLKYPYAFSVASTLKYKMKDFNKIPYTDLNRLFGSKTLKENFRLNKEEEDYKEKIEYLVGMFNRYKTKKKFKSFSREFNTISGNEDESAMKEFCNWVKEQEEDKRNFFFETSAVELFIDEVFNFDLLKLKIKNSQNSKNVLFKNEELTLNFIDPNDTLRNEVDMTMCGEWRIQINYKDEEHVESLIIKELLKPDIVFPSTNEVREGNTLNLRKLVLRATNGHGKDVKSDITIKGIGNVDIVKETLTTNNSIGYHEVSYSFTDLDGAPFSRTCKINIVDSSKPLHGAHSTSPLISFNGEHTEIDISNVVNQLVNEINQLNYKDNICIVVTSLRAVIELTFDQLLKKNKMVFTKKKDLKCCINEFINDLKNNKLTNLCNNNSSILSSYQNEYNRLTQFDASDLAAYLNLGAHKSVSAIDTTKICEIGGKYIGPILVYSSLILK